MEAALRVSFALKQLQADFQGWKCLDYAADDFRKILSRDINKMSVIKSVRRRGNKKKRQRDRNQFINRHYSLFSSKHKTIIEVNESLEILNFINLFIHTQQ